MTTQIGLLDMAQALARHAGNRQAVVARNVANANVAGYRSQDLATFAESYRQADRADLTATRAGHLTGETAAGLVVSSVDSPGELSPNGNTVSLETEMVRSADIRQQHDLAISVYRSALGILRTSLGRGA